MARYRKILVAYDGSSSSKNALHQAINLAREDKSWIKVVAVVPSYEGDLELIGVGNIKDAIAGPGRKLLAEALLIAAAEDAHILTDLEQGEPYEKIVKVAEEEHCDLIIMGRQGTSNLERELLGGVTARVIGHTAKDVLVMPEQALSVWNKLLLATDGSQFSAAAVDKAIMLAKGSALKLYAVSVVDANEEFFVQAPEMVKAMVEQALEILKSVQAKAEAQGVQIHTVVREGEPHKMITDVAKQEGVSLILMGSHGRKGLTRLLMGSVTERVIGFAPCPVLVAH